MLYLCKTEKKPFNIQDNGRYPCNFRKTDQRNSTIGKEAYISGTEARDRGPNFKSHIFIYGKMCNFIIPMLQCVFQLEWTMEKYRGKRERKKVKFLQKASCPLISTFAYAVTRPKQNTLYVCVFCMCVLRDSYVCLCLPCSWPQPIKINGVHLSHISSGTK